MNEERRDGNCRIRSSRTVALVVAIMLAGVAFDVTGDTVSGLEAALRRGGLPEDVVREIVSAAGPLNWSEELPRDADMDAVALSLAYAHRQGRLPGDGAESAQLALELARDASALSAVGFNRREVARMLTQGMRAHLSPRSAPLDRASRLEAAKAAGDRLRESARDAAERRNDSRPAGPPGGVAPPVGSGSSNQRSAGSGGTSGVPGGTTDGINDIGETH